ncbi:arylsulfotransferase family protein [Nocardioides sp. zg-1230]|uniref:arylsulfotransferase family protein n=1 Tax=Nocardioides sp. zg-1230 TaxID=2736601 RepID=UPI001552FDA9|nr:arylsulfotransferase family protein [Nocardioides sp. zg-1230]NPC44311.1 hypothetical protein [Nocardioides sp. zg-1230]
MRSLVALALAAGSLSAPYLQTATSTAAEQPVHDIVVSALPGSSVTTYPAFEPGIDRFSVRSAETVDRLSVTATSSDPKATIAVNGRPAGNGTAHVVEGLAPGEEVNVQITDASGTSNQSWIVLPPRFPDVRTTGPHPGLAPGKAFVTLSSFVAPPFSAVLDERGVPAMVSAQRGSDFKQSSSDPAHFSVALPDESGGDRITELDEQYREVRSFRLAGDKANSTDFHDSTLFPDGSALLMGYDYLARDGGAWTDAIIQRLDPDGDAAWTWNSKDHVDEAEGLVDRTPHDYAHINSMQELASGDVVASFRNLSQVMLIAGSDHDGFSRGDVIWRLGGLRNDFEFVDDPYGGPCAQHAAQVLPNGHLMIFDNGSRRDDSGPIALQTADMCPDPTDPDGPRVARPQSRITEYVLDTSTTPPTARMVWSHVPAGRYAPFAGNAQRLANGNTLAGWSRSEVPSGQAPIATEVTAGGEEIWSMTGGGHFSYRAFKYDAPDRIAPEVAVSWPTEPPTVELGADLPLDFGCSDTGGSNLDECSAGGQMSGADLPTDEAGTHQVVVRATDGAGNESTRTISYSVTAPPAPAPSPGSTPTPSPTTAPTAVPTTTSPTTTLPTPVEPTSARADATIRTTGGAWKGRDLYTVRRQTVDLRARPGRPATVRVRVRNSGDAPGRLRLEGTTGKRWATGRWYAGRRDVTARVRAGTYRTVRLDPGRSVRLRLVVVPRDGATGRSIVRLAARSRDADPDVVRARVSFR